MVTDKNCKVLVLSHAARTDSFRCCYIRDIRTLNANFSFKKFTINGHHYIYIDTQRFIDDYGRHPEDCEAVFFTHGYRFDDNPLVIEHCHARWLQRLTSQLSVNGFDFRELKTWMTAIKNWMINNLNWVKDTFLTLILAATPISSQLSDAEMSAPHTPIEPAYIKLEVSQNNVNGLSAKILFWLSVIAYKLTASTVFFNYIMVRLGHSTHVNITAFRNCYRHAYVTLLQTSEGYRHIPAFAVPAIYKGKAVEIHQSWSGVQLNYSIISWGSVDYENNKDGPGLIDVCGHLCVSGVVNDDCDTKLPSVLYLINPVSKSYSVIGTKRELFWAMNNLDDVLIVKSKQGGLTVTSKKFTGQDCPAVYNGFVCVAGNNVSWDLDDRNFNQNGISLALIKGTSGKCNFVKNFFTSTDYTDKPAAVVTFEPENMIEVARTVLEPNFVVRLKPITSVVAEVTPLSENIVNASEDFVIDKEMIMQTEFNRYNLEIAKLRQDVVVIQTELIEKRSVIDTMSARLTTEVKGNQLLQDKFLDLNHQVDYMNKTNEKLELIITELKSYSSSCDARIVELLADTHNFQTEIKNLSHDLSQLQASATEAATRWNDEKRANNELINDMKKQLVQKDDELNRALAMPALITPAPEVFTCFKGCSTDENTWVITTPEPYVEGIEFPDLGAACDRLPTLRHKCDVVLEEGDDGKAINLSTDSEMFKFPDILEKSDVEEISAPNSVAESFDDVNQSCEPIDFKTEVESIIERDEPSEEVPKACEPSKPKSNLVFLPKEMFTFTPPNDEFFLPPLPCSHDLEFDETRSIVLITEVSNVRTIVETVFCACGEKLDTLTKIEDISIERPLPSGAVPLVKADYSKLKWADAKVPKDNVKAVHAVSDSSEINALTRVKAMLKSRLVNHQPLKPDGLKNIFTNRNAAYWVTTPDPLTPHIITYIVKNHYSMLNGLRSAFPDMIENYFSSMNFDRLIEVEILAHANRLVIDQGKTSTVGSAPYEMFLKINDRHFRCWYSESVAAGLNNRVHINTNSPIEAKEIADYMFKRGLVFTLLTTIDKKTELPVPTSTIRSNKSVSFKAVGDILSDLKKTFGRHKMTFTIKSDGSRKTVKAAAPSKPVNPNQAPKIVKQLKNMSVSEKITAFDKMFEVNKVAANKMATDSGYSKNNKFIQHVKIRNDMAENKAKGLIISKSKDKSKEEKRERIKDNNKSIIKREATNTMEEYWEKVKQFQDNDIDLRNLTPDQKQDFNTCMPQLVNNFTDGHIFNTRGTKEPCFANINSTRRKSTFVVNEQFSTSLGWETSVVSEPKSEHPIWKWINPLDRTIFFQAHCCTLMAVFNWAEQGGLKAERIKTKFLEFLYNTHSDKKILRFYLEDEEVRERPGLWLEKIKNNIIPDIKDVFPLVDSLKRSAVKIIVTPSRITICQFNNWSGSPFVLWFENGHVDNIFLAKGGFPMWQLACGFAISEPYRIDKAEFDKAEFQASGINLNLIVDKLEPHEANDKVLATNDYKVLDKAVRKLVAPKTFVDDADYSPLAHAGNALACKIYQVQYKQSNDVRKMCIQLKVTCIQCPNDGSDCPNRANHKTLTRWDAVMKYYGLKGQDTIPESMNRLFATQQEFRDFIAHFLASGIASFGKISLKGAYSASVNKYYKETPDPALVWENAEDLLLKATADTHFIGCLVKLDEVVCGILNEADKDRARLHEETGRILAEDDTDPIVLKGPKAVKFFDMKNWLPHDWVVGGKDTTVTDRVRANWINFSKKRKLMSSFPFPLQDVCKFSWEKHANVFRVTKVDVLKEKLYTDDVRSKLNGILGKSHYSTFITADVTTEHMTGTYADLLSFYSHKLFAAESVPSKSKARVFINMIEPMVNDTLANWVDGYDALVQMVKRSDTRRTNTINCDESVILYNTLKLARDIAVALRSTGRNGSHLFRSPAS